MSPRKISSACAYMPRELARSTMLLPVAFASARTACAAAFVSAPTMTAAATSPGVRSCVASSVVVEALRVEPHVERVLEGRVAVGRLLQPEHVDARLELARARHVVQLRRLRRADRRFVERVDGLGHLRLEAVVVASASMSPLPSMPTCCSSRDERVEIAQRRRRARASDARAASTRAHHVGVGRADATRASADTTGTSPALAAARCRA